MLGWSRWGGGPREGRAKGTSSRNHRPFARILGPGRPWLPKGRRTQWSFTLMIALWVTFICWLVYRHSANLARLDPLDQTTYQLSNEQTASRCRSVALCESARLTCSVAKRVTTEKVAHDCRISNVTEPADRADVIRDAFSGAFEAYRACAWGSDLLQPLSCGGHNTSQFGETLVAMLPFLKLMGLEDHWTEASGWLANQNWADPPINGSAKLEAYTATKHMIGPLLSAYALDGESDKELRKTLLRRAGELGSLLHSTFKGSDATVLPLTTLNVTSRTRIVPKGSSNSVSPGKAAGMALEWVLLSRYLGQNEYEEDVQPVWRIMQKEQEKHSGLVRDHLNIESGEFSGNHLAISPDTAEYYETLLKMWILSGKKDRVVRDAYIQAMQGIRRKLFRKSARGLWYVGELSIEDGRAWPKMHHAACLLPGLLALGHHHGLSTQVMNADRGSPEGASDIRLARELMLSCYEGHRSVPSGLAPATWHWLSAIQDGNSRGVNHFVINSGDGANGVHLESAASLYLLWKVTGDSKYRDWSWMLFRAIERWSRVDPGDCRGNTCSRLPEKAGGYAEIQDVQKIPPPLHDSQPLGALGTLSYLWLIQSDQAEACAVEECLASNWAHRDGALRLNLREQVLSSAGYPLPLAGSHVVRKAVATSS